MTTDAASRTECPFKQKCYRKNPHHFKEFKHQHLHNLLKQYPDHKVDKDTGIGIENIKEQLKVYEDIEKFFLWAEHKKQTKKRSRSKSPEAQRKKELKVDPAITAQTVLSETRTESAQVNSEQTGKSESSKEGGPLCLIEQKLEAAKPFNFFLTKIKDNPATHKDMISVYLTDLMHPRLGKLKSSLQINFMVELDWLMMNYEATKNDKKPLVILYGEENSDLSSNSLQANIRAVRVKPKYPFGTHHTKMMVFVYEDESVRVVVHTANLVGSDWENRTQGVWVSPRCMKLNSSESKGESPTNFKSSLIKYLKFYEVSAVHQFIDAISNCDMSAINVFFVASVPNSHRDGDIYRWGHRAVSKILKQHVSEEARRWPVKVQCSSIGSLGNSPDQWFEHELGRSLSCYNGTSGAFPSSGQMELIYPSHNDVMSSYDGPLGGGCLPYRQQTHSKQPWLIDHMYNWRAAASDRTRAMPHIKTYTRLDSDNEKMAYFLLTSANLSKAAWGSMNKAGNSCMIMSYEAGVLFIPKFITGENLFSVSGFESRLSGSSRFPLHYDLPLQKYSGSEKPWLYDFLLS
ncbi:probable tyrosyl-DNA phosphodiesterase [Eurytemora carolleeae]|uniref:probable tyrosyl-DNA phosphodiesterase n=1 Tax=Eurytemora carolleeae TaxID=1294199 RepID=UPI000C757C75|nr:probable tyrosyl-DNA phosphodiesterase [Eurytemora carolleeae]|eukprot:XP_023331036.1 probable tyrosyl-DNA phosphodiesterase [Eurytemora affinis]